MDCSFWFRSTKRTHSSECNSVQCNTPSANWLVGRFQNDNFDGGGLFFTSVLGKVQRREIDSGIPRQQNDMTLFARHLKRKFNRYLLSETRDRRSLDLTSIPCTTHNCFNRSGHSLFAGILLRNEQSRRATLRRGRGCSCYCIVVSLSSMGHYGYWIWTTLYWSIWTKF